MTEKHLYFAYGSNMATARLGARLPAAELIGRAVLPGHQLAFHQRSERDGSGKCDAHATGDPADRVLGVLYRLAAADLRRLDTIEGPGYRRVTRRVQAADSQSLAAEIYLARADHVDPACRPWHWYLEHVLAGAREHGLPAAYVAAIELVAALPDPEPARDARERAVHR